MQSLPIYLYPNVTTVILDLDPTVSGVNISVSYGSSNNGQRRLSYFAIGN